MSERGFAIEESDDGRALVVSGPWSAEAEAVIGSGAVDSLALNRAWGFCESDLEFLRDWPIRGLTLLARGLSDLAPIGRLAGSLEYLSVEAASRAQVDLQSFVRLQSLTGDWKHFRATVARATGLETLRTGNFSEVDLQALAGFSRLRHLVIKAARRLESLAGLERLTSLSSFTLQLAPRLADISAVAQLSSSLRELWFETCGGLDSIDDVAGLKHLRELWVADCGDIASLKPIAGLPELEELFVWGTTRVLDADLSPIESLPRLREVRMKPRRAYRPPLAAVQSRLHGIDDSGRTQDE